MKLEVDRLLGRFDQTLQHREFLMGTGPQFVDFALFGVIGNYTYRDYNQLSPEHAALRSWIERLGEFRFCPV